MLVSVKLLGLDPTTTAALYEYQYRITDTDFEACVTVPQSSGEVPVEMAMAVIKEYSKRNLDVAANLTRLFRLNKYAYSLSKQVSWCKKYIPGFDQYEEGLKFALESPMLPPVW